jgi:restriction endonuclease S subunit
VFEVRSSVCHPGFLLVVLTDARFYSQIDEMVSGASGRRRVSSGRFCDLEIPLPTLDAQSALVGAIERQRAVLRGAELIKNNWAFDIGNLVGAETVRLGDHLVFVSSGSTPLGGEANYVGDGVLFIRSQNVLVGECDFSDAVFITEEIHRSMGRTSVQRFDVFLNITGASIGRSAVMAEDRPANVNQHVAILRPDEKTLNPFFLSCVLNSPALQKAINTAQMGASRQGLNFGQIRELRIPLPPLDVQNDVALRFRALLEATHCLGRIATHASAALAGATNGIWET